MKTVEEVERSMGFDAKTAPRYGSSGCSYNPSLVDDPAMDCNQTSRWHVRCRGENPERSYVMSACDVHLQRLLGGPYRETVLDRHEFGSACGLEGSWWISLEGECGSICVTEERGVELGFLEYVEDYRGRPD